MQMRLVEIKELKILEYVLIKQLKIMIINQLVSGFFVWLEYTPKYSNSIIRCQFDGSYTVDGNDVTYDVQYIKGYGVGTLIPKFAQIIKEDVLNHPNPWTFTDFNTSNFIVEMRSSKIYTIDFQSYCYSPDKEKRKIIWDSNVEKDKVRMERIYNGRWNHARIRKKG